MTKERKKTMIIIAVAVIFFIFAIVVRCRLMPAPVKERNDVGGQEIAEGVAEIQALSDKDVTEVESKIKVMERVEKINQIQAGNLNAIFEDAMIMGDSHAEGIYVYGLLDDSKVAAVKGHNLTSCDDDFNKVVRGAPKVLFINYGMNDVGIYGTDSAKFISAYKDLIGRLQEKLPDTKVYVCSIFQAQQAAIAKKAYLGYIPDYNAALAAMCQELQVGYIDTTAILTDEYYEPDHIHTNSAYHKLWLHYVAEESGLLDAWTD